MTAAAAVINFSMIIKFNVKLALRINIIKRSIAMHTQRYFETCNLRNELDLHGFRVGYCRAREIEISSKTPKCITVLQATKIIRKARDGTVPHLEFSIHGVSNKLWGHKNISDTTQNFQQKISCKENFISPLYRVARIYRSLLNSLKSFFY